MSAKFLGVEGKLQREGEVMHIIVKRLEDLTHKLSQITNSNFIEPIAHADELKSLGYLSETSRPQKPAKRVGLGINSRDFH